MLDINGEPFPWPFDIVIEILKHVAAEDPVNLYPQLCTVSKVRAVYSWQRLFCASSRMRIC
jgi:hypothetical protein